ncbi:MAG: DedA family protein [Clostridiales bacterium]|nr:DedA family protein [Clostridiales bacterium]
MISTVIDFILHFDRYLGDIISSYGALTYFLLFLIIFCETGLVVTPFLPGDSLIFVAGTFAAAGSLNLLLLFLLLGAAAISGDAVNYSIGKKLSQALTEKRKLRFVKQENIDKTAVFFEKHGGKTIVIARFIPIIRTFAPFVAGAGKMKYRRFLSYNALGGLLWVGLFSFGGYFFGNLPFVKDHFSLIIMAIVIISFLPALIMKLASRN